MLVGRGGAKHYTGLEAHEPLRLPSNPPLPVRCPRHQGVSNNLLPERRAGSS